MTVSLHGVTAHGHQHFTILVEVPSGQTYLFGGSAEYWVLVDGQVDTDPVARDAALHAYASALEVWGKLGPATALANAMTALAARVA